MMCLQHRHKIGLGARRRTEVRLQAVDERSEDRGEEGDLLLGDLVQNRDEDTDRFEEVELGVEVAWGARRFVEEVEGGGLVA